MAFRIPGETSAQSKFRQRLERAQQAQEEQDRRRHEAIERRIAQREWEEETRRWKDRTEFDIYLLAGVILDRLTAQRDENAPKGPDDPWNEKFCEAIWLIPEAKMFLEEMSIKIIQKEGING